MAMNSIDVCRAAVAAAELALSEARQALAGVSSTVEETPHPTDAELDAVHEALRCSETITTRRLARVARLDEDRACLALATMLERRTARRAGDRYALVRVVGVASVAA